MIGGWHRLLLALSLPLLVAAKASTEVDANQITCAEFTERGADQQKRILSFLQGYARREIDDQKVGSVAIGAGLGALRTACAKEPHATVAAKVQQAAPGIDTGGRGESRLTRPPTELTCRQFLKLDREDQRLTVYWLDGYSRKPDPNDGNQSRVELKRNAEGWAENMCGKRKQSLWSAIQGGVRSVDAAPPPG